MSDYVYLAEISTGLIKIGRSKDPGRRRRQIQTHSPYPIEEFLTMACVDAGVIERSLHERFADFRARTGGEWFSLPDDIKKSIKSEFKAAPNESPITKERARFESEVFKLARKLYYEVRNEVKPCQGYAGHVGFGGNTFRPLDMHRIYLRGELKHWKQLCVSKAAVYLAGYAYLAQVELDDELIDGPGYWS